MAAYAALVSLMNTIDQIHNYPRPPISLNTRHLQSLTTNITFLQHFLENYSIDALDSRIADAAYAAEDIIESHVVDKILHGHNTSSSTFNFIRRLEQVIQYLDTIKRRVANIKEKIGIEQYQLRKFSTISSRVTRQKNIMVGLDDVMLDIMDKLTGGSCSRQTIPIVGMGGIGKTTLARNVYLDSCVKNHFDILAWATVSHEYNAKEILTELLVCRKENGSKERFKRLSEHELGEMLYKSLVGRRYLIVLDDIWSVDAWDRVKFFFPDNDNKSRVMITTRLSNLASELTGGTPGHVMMSFLDEDKSWNLLRQTVFGDEEEEACPIEIEEIGKKIARNCKGLPLSIVVIGGLLAKSKTTREYWKHIAENLNSILKSAEDEHCTKILQMSYDHLPVHLKPCFLYIGMHPQDSKIRVSNLTKLWIAEGFLKPIASKSFEQAAREYLNDLVDRNLVFVSRKRYGTKIKYCKLHDLLMELCVREAQKHKFLFSTNRNTPPNIITNQRRVVVHEGTDPRVVYALKKYSPLVRSFTRKSYSLAESLDFRLMRVWNGLHANISYSLMPSPSLVNCRYIDSLNISSRDIPSHTFGIYRQYSAHPEARISIPCRFGK